MQEKSLMDQLYDKMLNEQEKYREWLLQQTPEEILEHTFEYTIRNDILLSISENDLTDEQAKALLSSESPLAEIYRDYSKVDTDHMEILFQCIENRAQSELYLSPLKANVACRDAIENAISDSYRDNRLNREGAAKVLEQYGVERVFYVLANTVQQNLLDGRYSFSNKTWAKTFPFDQTHNRRYVISSVHPGLVNLFIDQVKDIVQEQVNSLKSEKITLDDIETCMNSVRLKHYGLEGVEITEEDYQTVLERVISSGKDLESIVDEYLGEIREVLDSGLEDGFEEDMPYDVSYEQTKKPMLNELINSAAKERKEPEKSFDRQEPVK